MASRLQVRLSLVWKYHSVSCSRRQVPNSVDQPATGFLPYGPCLGRKALREHSSPNRCGHFVQRPCDNHRCPGQHKG